MEAFFLHAKSRSVVTDILYYVKNDCVHACNMTIPIDAHIPHGVRSVLILNSWVDYNCDPRSIQF